ncbi:BsuPI-related putative proteinase inhibitor [Halobaculum sp. MBLA0147]|uniref:BsuPI-related putative proteinase inhibitor n=1 Tax=Halobaculum sp. MBLA0147 TaxID=3079934 RepID=UPI0035243FD5
MVTATLTTSHEDGALALTLAVENDGDEPVTAQFRDAQRVEFVATRDGDEVWRWSAGRMFGQALGTLELAPGETATFDGEWPDPPAGSYTIRGELAATDLAVSDERTVEL